MTAYTTPAAVRAVLAPTVDGQPDTTQETAAQLSDAQIADAIRQASAKVDTYIAARYQTPVEAVPDTDPSAYPEPVCDWTRDLAAYYATLVFYRAAQMLTTDPVWLRYQDVLADLKAVSAGTLTLGITAATADDPGADVGYAGVADPGMTGLFGPEDWNDPPLAGWVPPGYDVTFRSVL